MATDASIACIDENDLLEKAESLIKKEKWDDAVALLRPQHEGEKLSIKGLKILAQCHSRNKDYIEASKIYEELCEKQPHDARLAYLLGYQYQMLKNWDGAVGKYEKCLELFPHFIKAYLQLGISFEVQDRPNEALKAYRKGFQAYRQMQPHRQKDFSPVCSKILTQAAKLLQSFDNKAENTQKKIQFCLKESVSCEPANADNLYRLGRFLLEMKRTDEALMYLKKAHSLAPHKEYISHKIAQSFLQKGEGAKAFEVYEKIPVRKRGPYILNGMAICLRKQGKAEEAARFLFRATQLEPEKFYHHRDFGMALLELGDRDQAIEVLENANKLFKKEHGKNHSKIIAAIEEARTMPEGERVVFEEPTSSVTAICYGVVTKYISERGFGFIKDNKNGKDVFFHIKSIKPHVIPEEGMSVKFLREIGEKGPNASKVWIKRSV
jgi:tetratricopeptide (TPR) repeat protein/cold shock CspA family protein